MKAVIKDGVSIGHGDVVIGDNCYINEACILHPGASSIVLEEHVVLAARVILTAASHNVGSAERRATGAFSAPIRVGAGSWLGAGAVVLPGVTVASGCIVGAGAVVTRDTKPNGVYVGVPARRLRDLPT
jgi:maltose O-acetyltransferase